MLVEERSSLKNVVGRFATHAAKLALKDIQETSDPGVRLEAAFLSAVAVLYGHQTIAGIIGQNLHQWFMLFYDDLSLDRALPNAQDISIDEVSWDVIGQFLAAGFLEKAKELILLHPVLQKDQHSANDTEYTQAECIMEFIGLLESRPVLSMLMDVENAPCGELVEMQDFLTSFAKWRDEDVTSFDALVSKQRSVIGDDLSDTLLDMEEIILGKDEILRKYSVNKVDLFFGRLFHDPHWIHNHLQLRISFESIVGKTGPLFSIWNQALYALMKDLFTMEGMRLCEYIADPGFAFDVCSRLSMGLILINFFEEHQTFWTTPLASLDMSFFDHYGDHFCSTLTQFHEIMKFVLFCPGLSKRQAINLLNKATMRDHEMSQSLLEETQQDDFDSKWIPLIDEAGLLYTLKTLIGKAHHTKGNISFAAYSLKSCGVSDEENIALSDAKALFFEILSIEKDIFCSALRVERLNIEELLSTGPQRRQIWTELNSELKSMSTLNTKHTTALQKASRSSKAILSKLFCGIPKNNKRILSSDGVREIEGLFQEVLNHPHLDTQMEFFVVLKALNVMYLFGSHLPGSSIFPPLFSKRIVKLVANRNLLIGLGDAMVTQSIQHMLCKIVETIKE
eukprot:g1218.t1